MITITDWSYRRLADEAHRQYTEYLEGVYVYQTEVEDLYNRWQALEAKAVAEEGGN